MKKWFGAFLLAVIVLAVAWTAWQLYFPYRHHAGSVILTIQPGARAPETAALLQSRGVLRRRLPFLFRYWLGRWRHQTIKSGEYQFSRPMSASGVYDKLVRGEVYLHTIVIPEGSDRMDCARLFHQAIGLSTASFMEATRSPAAIRDLDPLAPSLEGYLFPDTYLFPRGVAAARVVKVMLARFREVFNSEFRGEFRSGPDRLHDLITLASLVEKETPSAEERPMIAGVFTRRLAIGMPLQCDPTVIYAIRLGKLTADLPDPFKGPLTHSDLGTPSPYNTYLHKGLPPGPICNPGSASIRATLHPSAGTALYFVSNNHGGHVFAGTLSEQNRNVARYRKELQVERSAKPAATGR